MEGKVLIEIEEPDFVDLVNSREREELNVRVVKAIRSRVLDLFATEMKKIVKERYNLSAVNAQNMPGEWTQDTVTNKE